MSDDKINDPNDLNAGVEEIAKRLKVKIDVLRGFSPEEIEYLLDHCPFLQIVDTVLHYIDEEPPAVQFIKATTGWTIYDYGDALSSSPGEKILGLYDKKNDEDHEGGTSGTIRGQAYLTAAEMVGIAKSRGWKGIQIVDGHIIMKRGAWINALDNGMDVSGFEPDKKDQAVRERVKMSGDDFQVLRSRLRRQADTASFVFIMLMG